MKYCSKCGWEMQDDEVYCRNCGTKFDTTHSEPMYNATPFDDTPPKRVNKGTQIAIKAFLILAILGIIFSALEYFLGTSSLQEIITEVFAELSLDPEMQEVLGSIDQAQLESFIQTMSIVSGLISLIPLAWVLPMRKKILKAMNEGTTLTTGFKICTLLFVNFIAGILLLCSQDI